MLDFSHVPLGETVEVELNILLDVPAAENRFADREWWRFEVDAVPEIATSWILLPSDKASTGYAVVRWENDHPEVIEMVKPTHQTEMDDGSVINWSVVHPEPNYTYSTRWATE